MKKNKILMIVSILMIIEAIILFAVNIKVSGWGFYRIGGINTGGILAFLLMADIVWLIVKPNKVAKIAACVIFILLILSVILGIRLYLAHMSFFKFIAMALLLATGVGLLIRGIIADRE